MQKTDKLIAVIFSFVSIFAIFAFLIEGYTYRGFFIKHLNVNLDYFFALVIIFGSILIWMTISGEKIYNDLPKILRIELSLNKIFFPVITFIYFLLVHLESINFPNYVFSKYHLHPQNFLYPLYLSSFLLLFLFIVNHSYAFLERSFFTKDFWITLSLIFISYILMTYLLRNIVTNSIIASANLRYILEHANDSYDEKMKNKWFFFYDYMKFIQQHSENEATIIIPPQEGPWLTEGNAGLVRYFLYPRLILNGKYESLPDREFQYVFIAWGSWLVDDKKRYGWPKIPLKAEKIWYLDQKTNQETEVVGDYNPEDEINKQGWGLIRLKK